MPVIPVNGESIAPTLFWWDNFDRFVDTSSGENSIHNTPGVAFQEETDQATLRTEISITKSKRRSLDEPEGKPVSSANWKY